MTKVDQVRVIDFTQGEPSMGQGFNSETLEFIGFPLTFTPPIIDPNAQGQVVSGHALIVNSHEELEDRIGVGFRASARFGISSASAKMDYSKATGFNSTSTFVLASAGVENPIARGSNFQLTQSAQGLLTANNTDSFRTAFGDSFVRAIKTGGEFFAVFRLTSLKTTTQESLASTLSAEINGFVDSGSFEGQFQSAHKDQTDMAEVEVSFYQASGSGPTSSITLDVDSILKRLKDFTTIARDDPMPFKIEVATYDTIPIPIPTPEEHDDFLLSLAQDDAKKLDYIRRKNDVDFAFATPRVF